MLIIVVQRGFNSPRLAESSPRGVEQLTILFVDDLGKTCLLLRVALSSTTAYTD